jgi:hypothetical protein
MTDPTRLADAVLALAERADHPELRAQLHALRGALLNLNATPDPAAREHAEHALTTALEREDEPAVISAMRTLAALERASITTIDWSSASHG